MDSANELSGSTMRTCFDSSMWDAGGLPPGARVYPRRRRQSSHHAPWRARRTPAHCARTRPVRGGGIAGERRRSDRVRSSDVTRSGTRAWCSYRSSSPQSPPAPARPRRSPRPPENLLRGPARCVLLYLDAIRLAGPRARDVAAGRPAPAREKDYEAAKRLTAPRALVDIARRTARGEDHPLAPWQQAAHGAVLESFQLLAVRRAPRGAAVVTVRERMWVPGGEGALLRSVSEYLVARVEGNWRVVDCRTGAAFDDADVAAGRPRLVRRSGRTRAPAGRRGARRAPPGAGRADRWSPAEPDEGDPRHPAAAARISPRRSRARATSASCFRTRPSVSSSSAASSRSAFEHRERARPSRASRRWTAPS